MKKSIQILLAIVVLFTLVTGMLLGPDILINVGWNTGISAVPSQGPQVAYCYSCSLLPPHDMPAVGWNTGPS